ncbi:MAG: class I SAM-dependent methyltransferase [Candidatus Limnocylindrales bacterium]
MTPDERRDFIVAHTVADRPALLPEIELRLGGASMPLWEAAALADTRPAVPPPYWAWPWAGGQALARYVLDHRGLVRDRTVVDIGCGGGVVAIAAALAGARRVTAIDIEPFAIEATTLNAMANGVTLEAIEADPIDSDDGWDVVLVGDLWYEQTLAERMAPWLRALAARGATVITGDLGRAHLPTDGLLELARSVVATPVDLEDVTEKTVRVLQIEARAPATTDRGPRTRRRGAAAGRRCPR